MQQLFSFKSFTPNLIELFDISFKMKKSNFMISISDITLYIDPGSFTAICAAILGAIVGGVMFLKTKWYSIRYRKK